METERRCLQEKIGSCAGCGILEVAIEQTRLSPREDCGEILVSIQSENCPEGNQLIIPAVMKRKRD